MKKMTEHDSTSTEMIAFVKQNGQLLVTAREYSLYEIDASKFSDRHGVSFATIVEAAATDNAKNRIYHHATPTEIRADLNDGKGGVLVHTLVQAARESIRQRQMAVAIAQFPAFEQLKQGNSAGVAGQFVETIQKRLTQALVDPAKTEATVSVLLQVSESLAIIASGRMQENPGEISRTWEEKQSAIGRLIEDFYPLTAIGNAL